MFPLEDPLASLLLKFQGNKLTPIFAFTKNTTHEPILGRMQSPSCQHPIVSSAVPYGDKGNRTSSKTAHFSFRGPLGFEAHTVLLSVESDSPDQYTFESVGGNINLMGIVDFAEIRPNCMEVTLAVHYEIRNKLFAWLDRRLRFLDTFVTAELRSIRALKNGTTGFRMWDALERRTAATQIDTLNRWNKGEQTA